MKAKELSLQSKIFGGVFVLVGFVLNAVFKWEIATWDLIQIGIFFALIFAPVDISLWLEKFGKKV